MIRRLKKATPFVVSLTLHTLLLAFLALNIQSGDGQQEGNGQEGSDTPVEVTLQEAPAPKPLDGDIVPKEIELEELVPPPLLQEQSEVEVPKEEKVEGVTECQDNRWFGGIGIQQDWRTGTVEKVYPGYPADKAGLKPGDVIKVVDGIADAMGNKIRGEPGTTITLQIFRPSTNEYLTLIFKRDKICLGERL